MLEEENYGRKAGVQYELEEKLWENVGWKGDVGSLVCMHKTE